MALTYFLPRPLWERSARRSAAGCIVAHKERGNFLTVSAGSRDPFRMDVNA